MPTPVPNDLESLLKTLPDDVREAMLADVTAETIRTQRIGQQTRRLVFRGAAKQIQTETAPDVCISGPARTGKSLAVLHKVHSLLSSFPGARGLFVRKTRASLTETGLQTYEDDILGEKNPIKDGPARNNRSVYVYPNGSRFVIGGMDKATRIMSAEYDIIFVQEATELEENEVEMLSTRLSGGILPYPQLIMDCNPSYPQHWIKKKESEGLLLMLHSYHRDNPMLYDNKGELTSRGKIYMERLERLTGVRKQRLLYGLWVAAEGAIYPEWTEKRNLCNWFEPRDDWRRFLVVDFGFTNPMVVQWWAVDHDDRLYMYREIYETKQLVEDVAQRIREYGDFYRLETIVCDWDAEDRATLERHLGRETSPADKAVVVGIQEVQKRIRGTEGKELSQIVLMRDSLVRVDPELAERGKPVCTKDEVPGYAWAPDKTTGLHNSKEAPVKVDDHGCDGMRYASMYLGSYGNPEDWVIKPR
ncbi:phage terminase large subunit [Candidatus Pacearchaeota archaeon]|jgi:phage terminase large subunit|nr:phage terminase large subunit [Candidatus Pacearchaeota archaeon]